MEEAIKEAFLLTLKTNSVDAGFLSLIQKEKINWCSPEEFADALFDNLVKMLHEEEK